MSAQPPRLVSALLSLLLPARHREFILGDLCEEFVVRAARDGRWRAVRWYWRQAVASMYRASRYEWLEAPEIERGEPRRGTMLDAIRQDVRYALRTLNRRPLFTTVAVITLALGIGANTAVFSIANWLLLRPVPGVTNADRLAVVEFAEAPGQNIGVSWPNLRDLVESTRSFSDVFGYTPALLQAAVDGGGAQNVFAHVVAGDYFGTLGIRMQRGRAILSAETEPANPTRVAVLSDGLWRTMFNGDPDVIGRTFVANRMTFTVVGVVAPDFRGLNRHEQVGVWVPYSTYEQLRNFEPGFALGRHARGIREIVGRLNPGVRVEAAQAEWRGAVERLIAQHPTGNEILTERPVLVHEGIGVPVISREYTQSAVRLMLIIVFALLLISTANVANMLLVRGLERAPETAVRRLVGASSSRLMAQQLAESLVLTFVGGAVGIVIARVFLRAIEGGRLPIFPPIANIPLDWRVLGFAFAVSIFAGVVFALLPLVTVKGQWAATAAAGAAGRFTSRATWLRSIMVSSQTALSLALLIGAFLLGRTLQNLARVDLGFDPDQVYTFLMDLEPQGYNASDLPKVSEPLIQNLSLIPNVESVGLITRAPFACCAWIQAVADPNDVEGKSIEFHSQYVEGAVFNALRIPLLRGRVLDARDRVPDDAADRNVVINEAAAAKLFPGTEALGRTLSLGKRSPKRLHVVGVVGDVRQEFGESAPVTIYQPLSLAPRQTFYAVMRTRTGAASLHPAVQRAIAGVDPRIPAGELIPIQQHIEGQMAEQRLFGSMLNLFSVLAVLLAGVGLYGVLGVSVAQRTREIGIRMALGASARKIGWLVVSQSAAMILGGLCLGLLLAWWLGRLLESRLYGVTPVDAFTWIAAVCGFVLVAAIATGIPARAALRLQPSKALRQE